MKTDLDAGITLQVVAPESASPVMGFLDNLEGIVLREVGELRMDGFIGSLELQADELLAFFGRMPALTRVIATDKNGEKLRSVLDILHS